MKNLILSIFAAISTSAFGTTTFQLEIAKLRDSSGTAVTNGSVGILVADTDNSGTFSGNSAGTYSTISGTSLAAGGSIGSDTILAVFSASNGVMGDTFDVTYGGGIVANRLLGFYWFPNFTGTTLPSNLSQMGFYRSDTLDLVYGNAAVDGGIAFALPADGNTVSLLTGDTSNGGAVAPSSFTAFSIGASPEPSRALLVAFGAIGMVVRRRRRA